MKITHSGFIFCCLLIVKVCQNINCQPLQLNFNHLTPADGLSQSINAFIYHDSYGFVWISSLDGLNRFDGINMEVYRPDPDTPKGGMKGKNIQSQFFESNEGDIWFCTVEAINCYRRKTNSVEHYLIDSLLPANRSLEYYIFHLDKNNELWIEIDDGLYFFNIDSLKGKRIGQLDGIRCKAIDKVNSTEVFSYFKGNSVGLKKWVYTPEAGIHLEQRLFDGQQPGLPALNIHDILVNDQHSIYIASGQGLIYYSFEDNKIIRIDTFSNTQVEHVRAIIELNDRQLITSSSNGILVFDRLNKKFTQRIGYQPANPTSLSSNNVREIYLDNASNLWVSLWTIGVDYTNIYKTKFTKLKRYNPPTAHNGSLFDPGEMTEDHAGRTWYGSNQHGLLVFDQQQRLIEDLSFAAPGIKQVFKDSAGGIWLIPWEKYILYLPPEGSSYLKLPLPEVNTFNLGKLVQLSDGRVLFTKNEERGVFEVFYRNNELFVEEIKDPFLSEHYFNKGFFSAKDQLYLSHRNHDLSLIHYKNGQFRFDTTINVEGEVYSFCELDDHQLYIGGSFGFARLNQDSFQLEKIEMDQGLFISYVYSILPDKINNRLWLSTNQGLITYNLNKTRFRFYTPMDGLQDYEFNENSAMITKEGAFLFGGIKGYNQFFANQQNWKLEFEPKININKILVNDGLLKGDSNVSCINHLDLKYWEKTLSFHFVASEYSHPEANHLKYKMEHDNGSPYDEDWIQVNNRSGFARYPKLPSGKYKLRIQGTNSDGFWGQKEKVISIDIAYPFWQTPEFQISAFILIVILSWWSVQQYIARKLRVKNLEIRAQRLQIEKEEVLQKERDRLAEDMHDELGGSLTTIRILLQKIRNNAISKKVVAEIGKIDHYSLQVIQNMRFMVWAMQRENEYLENFIIYIRSNITQLLEDNGIRCSSSIPNLLPEVMINGFTRKHTWLCVKESVHNIIKHANAQNVNLTFELTDKLIIKVQDDGIGMPDLGSKPFGHGLENMRNRMEQINGDFSIININGTLVVFEVPIALDQKEMETLS